MTNEEYLKGNFAKALEETFVEIDYLLLSDEGYEKMTEIILEIKREAQGPKAKLEPSDLRDLKSVPFGAGCTSCVCLLTQDTIQRHFLLTLWF